MKARKAFMVLCAVCCLTAAFALEANAAQDWYMCTVDQVGPYGNSATSPQTYIYLTLAADNYGAPTWAGSKRFVIDPARANEYLATALTALANGNELKVRANGAGTDTVLSGVYIQK